MQISTKVSPGMLVLELAHRLDAPTDEVQRYLAATGELIAEHLRNGIDIALSPEVTLSLADGIEILGVEVLEEEPQAQPHLERVYVISDREEWTRMFPRATRLPNGVEVLKRLASETPTAIVFESGAENWQEVVRELKCDPVTNHIPIVGAFPEDVLDAPLRRLTFQPDTMLLDPEGVDQINDALSAAAADPSDGVIQIQMRLPGMRRDRSHACSVIEEMLYRVGLAENFCGQVRSAFAEALDNAVRHGHQGDETRPIVVRVYLDESSLVIAVRDSGDGFAKGQTVDAHVQATITGKGGIARMLGMVDMVDYNRSGNEVVLTKFKPA